MVDEIGMELNHTESHLETPLDNEKVKDVIRTFDLKEFEGKIKTYLEEKKKLVDEDRLVKGVCTQLFQNYKDDTNEYFTSFDDHIKLIDKEIEDQKASLLRGIERLKKLQVKKEKIIEAAEKVNSDNWELPYNTKELGSHFTSLLKEHILYKHPKLVGDYYGEHRYTGHARKPHIEILRDESGKITKVRCMDCYLEALKKTESVLNFSPSKMDGELDYYDKVGGK